MNENTYSTHHYLKNNLWTVSNLLGLITKLYGLVHLSLVTQFLRVRAVRCGSIPFITPCC